MRSLNRHFWSPCFLCQEESFKKVNKYWTLYYYQKPLVTTGTRLSIYWCCHWLQACRVIQLCWCTSFLNWGVLNTVCSASCSSLEFVNDDNFTCCSEGGPVLCHFYHKNLRKGIFYILHYRFSIRHKKQEGNRSFYQC